MDGDPGPDDAVEREARWLAAWAVRHPWLVAIGAILALLVTVLQLGLLGLAYTRIGIGSGWLLAILAASFLGAAVNVPIGRLRRPGAAPPTFRVVTTMGVPYLVPQPPRSVWTVVSLNLGGAAVPTALAVYLTFRQGLGWRALVAVAVVAAVVHLFAEPVRGQGVVVHALVPPVAAAGTALLIGGPAVPALAYVAGVLGCLVGADLLNLHRVAELDAPAISIGGAGTFDGIFLAGVMAVLIAGI